MKPRRDDSTLKTVNEVGIHSFEPTDAITVLLSEIAKDVKVLVKRNHDCDELLARAIRLDEKEIVEELQADILTNHNAIIDLLAPLVINHILPRMKTYECDGFQLLRFRQENQDWIAKCVAFEIAMRWKRMANTKAIEDRGLTIVYLKNVVRDVVREGWAFGRPARKKTK